ncbi:alkaline phosphatase family protein [Candidatus Woesearchaeota archaeon]|nr:alkaline phosphatase family protein [Candidatus Woesearchaeota archaeon]
MKNKTILIGLDGATWKNIMPWIEQDKLPFFKKIIDEGVYGINNTTIPCLTAPAIPSFYTGKSPAKHGIFGFTRPDGNLINFNYIKKYNPFWNYLSENRFNSLITNLRTTYPPEIENGILVSGILSPSNKSEFVYPKEYKKNFKKFHKDISELYAGHFKNKEIKDWFIDYYKRKIKAIITFIKKKTFDFYLFYFGATDGVQHFLYKDKKNLLEFYKRLDYDLENFLANFKGYNIIIFSDHGFDVHPTKTFHLNSWLYYKGYLKVRGGRLGRIFWGNIQRFAEKKISNEFIEKVMRLVISKKKKENDEEQILFSATSNVPGINWKKTKAYLSQAFGVSIKKKNVRDYEKFRIKLIEEMKKIKDEGGNRVFKRVYKKEEIYPFGKYFKQIPDIVFLLNPEYRMRISLIKQLIGKLDKKDCKKWQGAHNFSREGIFIAYGPDIKKGKKIGSINIYDIAPTVLHMYGVSIPEDYDGRVLKEIFKKKSKFTKRRILYHKNKEIKKNIVNQINI